MRIALIHDFKGAAIGGAEHNMAGIVHELKERGHTVDWYGFSVNDATGECLFEAPGTNAIEAADLLVVSLTNIIPEQWVNHMVAKHAGKYVVVSHDIGFLQERPANGFNNTRAAWYWWLFRGARAVFCISPYQATALQVTIEGATYRTLPIFCDNAAAFLEAKAIEKIPNRVVVVGRQSYLKGVEAVYRLALLNPQYDIHVYGEVPHGVREQLDEQANVTLYGQVPRDDLPAAYGQAEYFFHQPQIFDAGPRTLVEARLAGCELLTSPHLGYYSHAAWSLDDSTIVEQCNAAFSAAAEMIESEGVAACAV